MSQTDPGKVSRWDLHGREHVVRVRRGGAWRTLSCDTCGWRRGAPFLPRLRLQAQDHLADAHQATVDPTATRTPDRARGR
ncbi:hypothetical protein ACIQCD_23295 [Streptomyces sp. NPDC093250]|uniref:hypothetical protein n=1 Tax=unclassified Streptomyces TaxID=2593676 RepID=UPI00340FEC50